ncbi:MAG: NUDIX hydrolase [Chloroflexi bacterium]|nr:NUDIX hydrolase [Chloroflexota bacterium]
MQPEQMISSERVFDGRIVRVRADAVLLPNGRNATREVVEHRPSVVVVPVDADGNAVLVRQYRYPAEQVLLEAPAGVVEESETPDDCAMRELQEEIGFSSRDLRALGGFWMSPGYCTEFMYAYLAKDLVPSRLEADADESIEVERVSISRVSRLIRLGEIQDAKTIAALLMAVYLFDAGG